MKRRHALVSLLSAGGLLAIPAVLQPQGQEVLVEVWKSPTCGCCNDWNTHLEANGFRVKVNDVGNTAARARLKVPMKLGSCHTAWVGGYAIEGHVPAADIRRLLKERPDAIGLAVPGMPLGSPGMDGPAYDNRQDPYPDFQQLLQAKGTLMNHPKTFTRITGLALLISAAAGSSAWAASHQGGHGAHHEQGKPMAQAATGDMTDAEVRKVDKEGGKLTLKHGDIKSLDMPAMTMVFVVKDKAMLDKLKAGDKVKFKAINDAGKFTVTEMQMAQ